MANRVAIYQYLVKNKKELGSTSAKTDVAAPPTLAAAPASLDSIHFAIATSSPTRQTMAKMMWRETYHAQIFGGIA
jgi:hypothetical protein